ncbi:MAG TPA: hypothetical protein VGO37_10345 [Steroidobacteraceae bacterium]|nr:hypothetical protein [Steroidobacteraceae bacterium]
MSPDQLALFGTLGAAINMAGAIFGGWLSTRIGPWNAYLLLGWSMIVVMMGFAFSPRAATYFMAAELCYRALATASYATLLAIVMKAIGKGAASTKAAGMWSLTNLAFAYPTLIEGSVHDRAGTLAMLLTDVSLAVIGFGVLMLAIRVLRPGIHTLAETVETGKTA